MFLLRVAEYAQPDVDLSLAKRLVPILWIVDAFVSELPGSRRHPFAKRFGKALQRISRDAEGLDPGVTDPDRNPGIRRVSPTRGGIDIRCQLAQEPAARLSIVDAQKHVGAQKYGAGLCRRTVAWISCNSITGEFVETFPLTDSCADDIGASFLYSRAGSIPARTPNE